MSEAKIDLVAVAYNAPAETEAMLQSASLHISTPFTLTLLDNKSPDPTVVPMLHRMAAIVRANPACEKVRILHSTANHGYAKACNTGASMGTAPLIGLLNCDIQFLPDSIERLVDSFDRQDYQDVGIIGPRTTSSSGLLTHAGILRRMDGRDEHRAWLSSDNTIYYRDEMDVPTVSGATYFVRRKVWDELTRCPIYQEVAPEALGAFLPTRHFFEETWCSYHAWAHGWRVRYQGDVKMIHEWHRSSSVGSQPMAEAEQQFLDACRKHDIETW